MVFASRSCSLVGTADSGDTFLEPAIVSMNMFSVSPDAKMPQARPVYQGRRWNDSPLAIRSKVMLELGRALELKLERINDGPIHIYYVLTQE